MLFPITLNSPITFKNLNLLELLVVFIILGIQYAVEIQITFLYWMEMTVLISP
jgi:hypothetical protein